MVKMVDFRVKLQCSIVKIIFARFKIILKWTDFFQTAKINSSEILIAIHREN